MKVCTAAVANGNRASLGGIYDCLSVCVCVCAGIKKYIVGIIIKLSSDAATLEVCKRTYNTM